jgi:hypothetical protein
MDIHIISIILSYTPYNQRTVVRNAISSYIHPTTAEQIFAVDINKIPAIRFGEYIDTPFKLIRCVGEKVVQVCIDRKIYVDADQCGGWCHRRLVGAIDYDDFTWLRVNSFNTTITDRYTTQEILGAVQLDLVPYTNETCSLIMASRTSYTIDELIQSFINARKNMGMLPSIYDVANMPDSTFRLCCIAIKYHVWGGCENPELVRRLILATGDRLHNNLHFVGKGVIESYIIAHHCVCIEQAPSEVIVKAYMLRRQYASPNEY